MLQSHMDYIKCSGILFRQALDLIITMGILIPERQPLYCTGIYSLCLYDCAEYYIIFDGKQ